MWSHIFIGHLYLRNIGSRIDTQDTCYDKIQPCACNIDTILGSVVNIMRRVEGRLK